MQRRPHHCRRPDRTDGGQRNCECGQQLSSSAVMANHPALPWQIIQRCHGNHPALSTIIQRCHGNQSFSSLTWRLYRAALPRPRSSASIAAIYSAPIYSASIYRPSIALPNQPSRAPTATKSAWSPIHTAWSPIHAPTATRSAWSPWLPLQPWHPLLLTWTRLAGRPLSAPPWPG